MIAAQVKEAVREYRGLLEDALPGRVRRVVLYGPWARGEINISTTVKVLVLVSEASAPERLWAADLAKTMLTEHKLTIDSIVLSVPQWNELERRQGHFVREVAKDGVDITIVDAVAMSEAIARRNTA